MSYRLWSWNNFASVRDRLAWSAACHPLLGRGEYDRTLDVTGFRVTNNPEPTIAPARTAMPPSPPRPTTQSQASKHKPHNLVKKVQEEKTEEEEILELMQKLMLDYYTALIPVMLQIPGSHLGFRKAVEAILDAEDRYDTTFPYPPGMRHPKYQLAFLRQDNSFASQIFSATSSSCSLYDIGRYWGESYQY